MIFLIHISSEGRAREPYPFPVSKAFQILRILSRLHVGREVRDKSGPTSSVAVRHWGPLGLQREIQALLFRDRSRLGSIFQARSEEHTSELQSRSDLVCRLLLEKKKKKQIEL